MDLLDKGGYSLRNLGRINVVVGKNGCGKSRLLKTLEEALGADETIATVRYLTPERGGMLQYLPNVDNNIIADQTWLRETRRSNQFSQFREQSVALFRNLEITTLRQIQNDPEIRASTYHFDLVIESINSLLDNIQIAPAGSAFEIRLGNEQRIEPRDISSGEAELISLAIEVRVFQKEAAQGQENILLIDEPDLHLHPDLQHRFAQFVVKHLSGSHLRVLLATHSTSLMAALAYVSSVHIAFMKSDDVDLSFVPLNEVHRRVLPVFGAHPLSQVFNESPILLVEGEDDERIWQQAVRSSNGRLRLFPRAVNGGGGMNEFEEVAAGLLRAVYDDPRGYSLRDGDNVPGQPLEDLPPLVRLRLNCRSAENLIVSDEVLAAMGTEWATLERQLQSWLASTAEHEYRDEVIAFRDSGFDRRCADLKGMRNLLVGLAGSNKPWEVLVGSVIAALRRSAQASTPDSIYSYLGVDLVKRLLPE